jgi:N-acetylmuramoyl-L-alanine amidase
MRKATDLSLFRAACGAGLSILLTLVLGGCSSYDSGSVGNFSTVVVDAGHGGHDTGARARGGSHEKHLALDTSRRLATELRRKGFRVIETRTLDNFVTLDNRVGTANRTGGAIFVSVHYNWARRASPQGIEIYYYNPRSRPLAANILRQTLRAYPATNRGVKRNNYYVLRNNRRPAVLCELGFVSSPHDNRYIQNATYRQRLAERIADGIAASRR